MSTTPPTRTDQAGVSGEETRAHLLAKLSNDHLLKLREAVAKLHTNLDSSYWYSFSPSSSFVSSPSAPRTSAVRISTERDNLLKEVKALKADIEEEYATRLLLGYRSDLQKMIAELSPKAQAVKGQLIPINAEVAAQQAQDGDTLQEAAQLVERLRVILDQEAKETATEETDEEGQP